MFGLDLSTMCRRGGRRAVAAGVGWTVVLLVAIASATSAGAATHIVPGDFPAIQAALNAAQAGDTVQVREQATPYHGNRTVLAVVEGFGD